jgi:hypothetical protein
VFPLILVLNANLIQVCFTFHDLHMSFKKLIEVLPPVQKSHLRHVKNYHVITKSTCFYPLFFIIIIIII